MDTRTKILDWTRAREVIGTGAANGAAPTVVTGHFDPLLAQHVTRLAEIASEAGAVVVVVTDPERPLLTAGARAELVAALQDVAFVTLCCPATEEFLRSLPPDMVIREETADAGLAADFAAHVRKRQAAV